MQIINTYSGLAKHFAAGDAKKLESFRKFALSRHLYDPHFYMPSTVNFYQLSCNPKKKVSDERIKEVIEGIVCSIYLAQTQVYQAVDKNNVRILKRDECLPPEKIEIYSFVYNKFLKKIIVKDLFKNSAFKNGDELDLKSLSKAVFAVCEPAQDFILINWKNNQALSKKFEELKLGRYSHIYGTRKPTKVKAITKNEIEFVKKFLKRESEDLKLFLEECEEKGLKETFNKWGKEKRFISNSEILAIRLKGKLRSKAFKRFAARVGTNFTKFIEKYQPDRRGGDHASAAFKTATRTLASTKLLQEPKTTSEA